MQLTLRGPKAPLTSFGGCPNARHGGAHAAKINFVVNAHAGLSLCATVLQLGCWPCQPRPSLMLYQTRSHPLRISNACKQHTDAGHALWATACSTDRRPAYVGEILWHSDPLALGTRSNVHKPARMIVLRRCARQIPERNIRRVHERGIGAP